MQEDLLHFRHIPKALNVSGASTSTEYSTCTITSTPLSVSTDHTSFFETSYCNSPLRIDSFPKNLPLNKSQVAATPFVKSKQKKCVPHLSTCSSCHESLYNMFEGERLVDLQCGHSLHFECFIEILMPVDIFETASITDHISPLNELICPSCNIETFCADKTMMGNLKKSQFLQKVDKIYNAHVCNTMESEVLNSNETYKISQLIELQRDAVSNVRGVSFDSTDSNGGQNINTVKSFGSQTVSLIDDSNYDFNCDFNQEEDPITPQSQIGINFWENKEEGMGPLNFNNTERAVKKEESFLFNSDLELAKILFAPEFSSVNKIENNIEIGCVLNISATEFEESLELNKMEKIKTQIGKNKVTDYIIESFESNLNTTALDYSSIGGLILFDIMDVIIKVNTFKDCQVFLFETNIIILNGIGNKLLLNQELNSQFFISSIYEHKNNIILNLNSLKLPNVTFTTDNKILRHKWIVVLTKISKNIDVMEQIPLIQTSTNAWSIINEACDDEVVPNDIKIANKLTAKGLDLPSKFLKRQILRPDPIPKTIILALPLVNCESYGLENGEFAESIKQILRIVLNLMSPSSKLGVVFLGSHLKDLETIGNYYGCTGKEWLGWELVLDSITEKVISYEDRESDESQWNSSWKYIERFSSLNFNTCANTNESLNHIICVSNGLLLTRNTIPINNVFVSSLENPFLITNKKDTSNLNQRIKQLCDKYEANFNYILLTDEFRFEPEEILSMNQYLKSFAIRNREQGESQYDNQVSFQVALDFEVLRELLAARIDELNKVTIKNMQTKIKFPGYVKLTSFESPCGKIKADLANLEFDNTYNIDLRSLPSGYKKSFFFSLNIDTTDESINNQLKATLAMSNTKIIANKIETDFKSILDIKFITADTGLSNNNMTINLNVNNNKSHNSLSTLPDYNMNLSIVSKLSSVSDAFYIKRKIQLYVVEKLLQVALTVKKFDQSSKEIAIIVFKSLIHEIWELTNSCNSSNTNNINDNNIIKWSELLIGRLEDIVDGYSLRNYQLSNMKCVILYLQLA